jgi:hypothetical protein
MPALVDILRKVKLWQEEANKLFAFVTIGLRAITHLQTATGRLSNIHNNFFFNLTKYQSSFEVKKISKSSSILNCIKMNNQLLCSLCNI